MVSLKTMILELGKQCLMPYTSIDDNWRPCLLSLIKIKMDPSAGKRDTVYVMRVSKAHSSITHT